MTLVIQFIMVKKGNIIPRDILNLGRSIGKGFTDIYAGYRGNHATSPLPNKDQGIDQRTKYIGGLPVDMSKRLSQADRIASKFNSLFFLITKYK